MRSGLTLSARLSVCLPIVLFQYENRLTYFKQNLVYITSYIHFPIGSQVEHRAPFGVSVITYTLRHTVGLLWTSDQPVAEASTYTGQHNI
jgi:hypothetical protein